MHSITVSIIVPIYKSAQYIQGLMNSILAQTYSKFELIVVNDGSPDNSLSMLLEWAGKDQRVKVINKPNGGVSSARNAGIDSATGDYIWFFDHDDYAFPDTLETMCDAIGNRDFLIAGWLKANNRESALNLDRNTTIREYKSADNLSEMRAIQPFDGWIGCLWRCLFKRSIFIENDIRFKSLCYEDSLLIYEFLNHCSSCSRIDFEGYVHITTLGSLGLSHKYCADERWLEAAMSAGESCIDRFCAGQDFSFSKTLHLLYSAHCFSFVTNGYHKDTAISYKERIKRWNFLHKNPWYADLKRFGYLTRIHTIFWYICYLRLYYIIDPIVLVLTRFRDR